MGSSPATCPRKPATPLLSLPARPPAQALAKSGSVLGLYQLRVSPSKTAIVPVKSDFLPTSVAEREAVARTVRGGLGSTNERL